MQKQELIPKNIEIARLSRGLSQPQLAELIGVTQASVSKFENGQIIPSEEMLDKICTHLGYPQSFFSEYIKIFPSLAVNYRKRRALRGIDLDQVQHSLYIMKHAIKKMLKAVEFNNNMHYITPDEHDPETIAYIIREKWKVPRGPIKNLVNLVESAGVIVMLVEANNDKLDGEVLPDDDSIPVIYLNKNISPDRLRFTLAHELGHLIMHTGDYFPATVDDAEKEANSFASELLMPSHDVRYQLDESLNLARLADLKTTWKVSMAAIVRKAYNTGAIDARKYKSLNVQLSQAGYKKNEPELGISWEYPTIVKQMISLYTNELGYSMSELATYVSLTELELHKFKRLYYPRETFSLHVNGKPLQINGANLQVDI